MPRKPIKGKKKSVKVAKILPKQLIRDVRELISASRDRVATTVNTELVWLYWNIGKRIKDEVLRRRRADYGEKVIETLSTELVAEFGRGFTRRNLFYMTRFAEAFPDEEIVHALRAQLSWTHFRELIGIDDPLKREFYAELCRSERWSTRTLQSQIKRLVYERTSVSKQPEKIVRSELAAMRDEDRLSPDLVFRDPYFLDFLGLSNKRNERDIENAILRELESFILELGGDFAFVARQKRMSVDSEDYYLDLLFYHRRMRRLVAIDLKLGKFQAADKGQMELYLRWLEENEMREGEESPIGLILCADKSEEHVKLLRLGESGIRVAAYLTDLPSRKLLESKLHEAIQIARQQLSSGE
jgi:predicted nuclease of restriction endonuclease-like (RecB) superfamily